MCACAILCVCVCVCECVCVRVCVCVWGGGWEGGGKLVFRFVWVCKRCYACESAYAFVSMNSCDVSVCVHACV